MFIERRGCLRHKVHGPVFASFDGVTGGMILDLSEQGLSMQSVVPLKADRRVQLRLDLPTYDLPAQARSNNDSEAHLETTGYIAWADALGRAGVRFSDLPAEARQRLDRWLALNEETPSLKAPKLDFDRAIGRRQENGNGNGNGKTRSISVEAENLEGDASPEDAYGQVAVANTVQYEFHPLGPDLNAALRTIAERARTLLRGAGAAIAIDDRGAVIGRRTSFANTTFANPAEGGAPLAVMLCRASVGVGGPPLGTRVDLTSGFSGECIRTGKALRCDDTDTDPRVDAEICRKHGIRSLAAAPIRYERDVVGLVEVCSPHSFAFDEGDLAVLERLAQTAILVVSQSHLQQH
jgi:hypothetical protein